MSNSSLKSQTALSRVPSHVVLPQKVPSERHPAFDPSRYLLQIELDTLKQCAEPDCTHVFYAADGVLYTAEWKLKEDGTSFYGAALFCSLECVLMTLSVDGRA